MDQNESVLGTFCFKRHSVESNAFSMSISGIVLTIETLVQARVVRKPVKANPVLKVSQSVDFLVLKCFSLPMFCVALDYSTQKRNGKQY